MRKKTQKTQKRETHEPVDCLIACQLVSQRFLLEFSYFLPRLVDRCHRIKAVRRKRPVKRGLKDRLKLRNQVYENENWIRVDWSWNRNFARDLLTHILQVSQYGFLVSDTWIIPLNLWVITLVTLRKKFFFF